MQQLLLLLLTAGNACNRCDLPEDKRADILLLQDNNGPVCIFLLLLRQEVVWSSI